METNGEQMYSYIMSVSIIYFILLHQISWKWMGIYYNRETSEAKVQTQCCNLPWL